MVKWLRILIIILLSFNLQSQAQFTSVSFSVQAHEDDWQLFMSSRIIADMSVAGTKMVFITLTAGDESCGACTYGGGPIPFYLGRENGSVNSSKFAADLTTGTTPLVSPTAATVAMNGHNITKYVYKNTVNYFFRLPDGDLSGNGFSNNNFESLKKLRNTNNPMHAVDGSTIFTTWADLTATIKAIINAEKITGTQSWIHTAHTNTTYNLNDHSDHIHSGIAATDAVSSGMAWVGVNGFMDYNSSSQSANLSDVDHENAAIVFSLEVFGMTEAQYQNEYSIGHQGWLPMDLFQVIQTPSGNAPFAGSVDITDKNKTSITALTSIPMIISVTSPASVDKDINISISPYEPGEIITTISDLSGNKVYDLKTTVTNRDAFVLTLKNAVKVKGNYIIRNILNNKYTESRKIVVE